MTGRGVLIVNRINYFTSEECFQYQFCLFFRFLRLLSEQAKTLVLREAFLMLCSVFADSYGMLYRVLRLGTWDSRFGFIAGEI